MQKVFKNVKIFTVCKPEIGSGHLIRSLLIKDALKESAEDVKIYGEFVKVPTHIKNIENFEFKNLNEFDFTNDDFIIIDTYIGRSYFNDLNVKKFLMHDSGINDKISDSIKIDMNFTSDNTIDPNKSIQGYKYFPIGLSSKPEFKSKKVVSSKSSKKILISLGGVSDRSLIDIKKVASLIDVNNFEIYIADPSKKLSKLNDLKEYNFIHGKFLSDILTNHLFKFAILGGGISKFITISSGLPCIYIPRNELEKIHLQNIRNLNLGYVVNSLNEIPYGINYIEENYELISKKSWDAIDGSGPKRFLKAIERRLN